MPKILDKVNNPEDLKKLSVSEIQELCNEIREFITSMVFQTGGHLGSSLGTVELAVALHYVYNSPIDKIIWDIGHQSYAHKILTGQKNLFSSLRMYKGISGFTNPFENPHDFFIGGHSSTSISNAMGLQLGMLKQQDKANVVNIIGDSAIGAGIALEAINHLGSMPVKMLVILNDNNMSISKTTGALSNYFSKIKTSRPMVTLKNLIKQTMPKPVLEAVKKINSLSHMNLQSNLFEDLGFDYVGPVDGHDVQLLIEILNNIKNLPDNKPILLHVLTTKGKGYSKAESAEDRLHGVEATGGGTQRYKTNTTFFAESLDPIMENPKVVAITGAMLKGTGLEPLHCKYPKQVFDVGIAEQHGVSFAAGLAKAGLIPFVCIYSTFMQRAYDQVVHDIALANLPVRFVLDRAGLVGQDGITHHGLLDYSMFLPLPNIIFMAPSMQQDIAPMLQLMVNINNKPSFIRYAKNYYPNLNGIEPIITMGKGRIIQQGKKIAVLSIGGVLHDSIAAAKILQERDKLTITVADAVFAKPIDEELILELVKNHEGLIIVEEGLSSVFANLVMNILIEHDLLHTIRVRAICIKEFIPQGTIAEQKGIAHINSESIYNALKNYL
ncbi:1-deoxy-D-xylulose-5-phosphate synthase [Candidatus Hepatincola sp. Pdp]